MSGKKNDRKAYGQTALTALCAAGLFSVCYLILGMYPFGDGSILITDLYSQYVPLLYRFYDVVTGQKNLFLDLSVSGGANLYADTINEVINPFNYVLLLFSRDRLYQAVNVVLLLYVTAAAASADFFLIKLFPKSRSWNVVLSLCYAFSGYMAYHYQIIKWMYFPVLFPLFCLAFIRLLREKKGGLYAALLGYQLALSIQLGFMTLLFALFSSGIYFYGMGEPVFFRRRRAGKPDGGAKTAGGEIAGSGTGKKAAGKMCCLGAYTVLGLLLSAAVLLPNIRILLSSSRAGENLSYLDVMKRHGLDDLFERLFQIGHPVLLALFVRAYAGWRRSAAPVGKGADTAQRRSGLRSAVLRSRARFGELPDSGRFLFLLNAFLWVTVLLQPANLLWHMGSYVCFPVRYAYMVLLSGVCLIKWLLTWQEEVTESGAACRAEAPVRSKKRKTAGERLAALSAALLCVFACLLTLCWEERIVQAFSSLAISLVCPKETLVVCGILLLFFAAGLCSPAGKNGGWLMAGIAALCGLCLWLFIFLPPGYSVRLSNEAAYRKMMQQLAEGEEGSAVLYRRKDDPELPLNAGLVNLQSSMTGYFPTADSGYKEAMEALGYLVPWVATQSVGGTAVSDELWSMGLLFEQTVSELEFQSETVLGRQEELSALLTGSSCLERLAGNELDVAADGAAVLQVTGEQVVYLDPALTADCFRIFVNGTELEVPEAASAFSEHRIVELGAFAEETVEILVTDQSGTALPLDGMEFGLLDCARWAEGLEALQHRGAEKNGGAAGDSVKRARLLGEAEWAVHILQGSIRLSLAEAEAGQTVFLPVAALDGWRCVLNGEAVDIAAVFGGFLGITTQEGSNEIVLRFTPPGLAPGVALTALGLSALLLGAVWRRRRTAAEDCGPCGESGAAPAALERGMSGLYKVLLTAGWCIVYIIPAVGLLCYMAAKVLGIW